MTSIDVAQRFTNDESIYLDDCIFTPYSNTIFIGSAELVEGQNILGSYQSTFIPLNAVVSFQHLHLCTLYVKNAVLSASGRVVITGTYRKKI